VHSEGSLRRTGLPAGIASGLEGGTETAQGLPLHRRSNLEACCCLLIN
jgi:hypothetical protein